MDCCAVEEQRTYFRLTISIEYTYVLYYSIYKGALQKKKITQATATQNFLVPSSRIGDYFVNAAARMQTQFSTKRAAVTYIPLSSCYAG